MNHTGKNRFKKTVIITACIILFLGMSVVGVNIWLAHTIGKKLETERPSINGRQYQVQAEKIRARLFGNSVRLENIVLVPVQDTIQDMQSGIRKITVRLISAQGVRVRKENGRYSLRIHKLTFENPDITCNLTDISVDAPHNAPRKRTEEKLHALVIDDIQIEGGHFDCSRMLKNETVRYVAEGIRFSLGNMQIDTSDFKYGAMRLAVDRLKYTFHDQTINLITDSLFIDTRSEVLRLSSFRIIPIYPQYDYASLVQDHADWSRIKTGRIDLVGVDYEKIFSSKSLYIDSATVQGAEIKSYKNRQIEQPARLRSLSYISLHELPFPVDIRKIVLNNFFISYEELAANGNRPGIISFDDVNAECSGLSNIATSRPGFNITLDARCKLMNEGMLTAKFKFSSDSTDNRFEVNGKLGPMNLRALNPMIEPLSNIQIRTGHAKSLDFSIQGNPVRSEVNLKFLYGDLSVVFIKHDTMKERTILTGFVDKLLIRSDNPDRKGTRIGKGTFERNPYRSQFNYLWKSLFPGIKKTVITI